MQKPFVTPIVIKALCNRFVTAMVRPCAEASFYQTIY
jgi:hypothetical protein